MGEIKDSLSCLEEAFKPGLIAFMPKTEIIDSDQFMQLIMLEDPDNPEFVVQIIDIFLNDVATMLGDLQTVLFEKGAVDVNQLRAVLHKLRGSSMNLGTKAITESCLAMRKHCADNDFAKFACDETEPGSYKSLVYVVEVVKKLLMEYKQIEQNNAAIKAKSAQ